MEMKQKAKAKAREVLRFAQDDAFFLFRSRGKRPLRAMHPQGCRAEGRGVTCKPQHREKQERSFALLRMTNLFWEAKKTGLPCESEGPNARQVRSSSRAACGMRGGRAGKRGLLRLSRALGDGVVEKLFHLVASLA